MSNINSVETFSAYLIMWFVYEVSEEDIEEMFSFADTDKDGRISYKVSTTIIPL